MMRSSSPDIFVPLDLTLEPPRTPKNEKKDIFKSSLQIVFSLNMYTDIGERIAWKHDRPSFII